MFVTSQEIETRLVALQFVENGMFWTVDRHKQEIFGSLRMFDLWEMTFNPNISSNNVAIVRSFETRQYITSSFSHSYGFHHYPTSIRLSQKDISKIKLNNRGLNKGQYFIYINNHIVCDSSNNGVEVYYHSRHILTKNCAVRIKYMDVDNYRDSLPLSARLKMVHFVPAKLTKTILMTYANKGRVDSVFFWYSFAKDNVHDKFLLVDFDSNACGTLSNVISPTKFSCMKMSDLNISITALNQRISNNNRNSKSSYFQFMRFKVLGALKILQYGYNVLNTDTDVVFMNPNVMTVFDNTHDLVIQSDERVLKGICELWNNEKAYSRNWICAGFFFIQSTESSLRFLHMTDEFIVKYELLDQDAMQAVLTGNSQVCIPDMQTFSEWTSVLYVNNNRVNPELSSTFYESNVASRLNNFKWTVLDKTFMNGPLMAENFLRLSSASDTMQDVMIMHGNCGVKEWLRTRKFQSTGILIPHTVRKKILQEKTN